MKASKTRINLFRDSLNAIKIEGLYVEFGLSKGGSAREICSLTSKTLYGFDSFQGLPEDWDDIAKKGHFKLYELPKYPDNVIIVVGKFENSLPWFLKKHPVNMAFIHMDADVYSSTKYVLFTLAKNKRIVSGTVIQLDELLFEESDQEKRAFEEFVKEFNVEYEYIGTDSIHASIIIKKIS